MATEPYPQPLNPVIANCDALWRTGRQIRNVDCASSWHGISGIEGEWTAGWASAEAHDAGSTMAWASVMQLDPSFFSGWSATGTADEDCNVSWFSAFSAEEASTMVWNAARGVDEDTGIRWAPALQVDEHRALAWEAATILDQDGGITWEEAARLDIDCHGSWRPSTAPDVEWGAKWGLPEPGEPPTTIWVPRQADNTINWTEAATRIMISVSITCKRVRDDADILILGGSLDASRGACLWSGSMTVPRPEDAEMVVGEELLLTVNGWQWRVKATEISENYGRASGTWSVRLESLSRELSAPICPTITQTFTATTGRQVAEAMVAGTDWAIDWRLGSQLWPIDGDFTVTDASRMSVLIELAKSVGGFVQTHPHEKKIILRAHYPASPRHLAAQNPDEWLNQGLLSVGRSQKTGTRYNAVRIRGVAHGHTATIRATDSAGDREAPPISDPLLTSSGQLMERARYELIACQNANRYDLTFPLTENGSGQRPRLVQPGDVVAAILPLKGNTVRGYVDSVSVAFGRGDTRQRIVLEEVVG